MERTHLRLDRLALAVAALALLTYVPGSWWGAPTATAPDRVQSWGVDDESPLGPLAEMHNIFKPKPDRNLGYPLLYDFLVAGAYAPYLGTLLATGEMHHMSAAYPFGLADPVHALRVLALIAHLLTVLLGAVAIVAGFDAARTLWGPAAGLAGAVTAMTLFPMFYYARTGNVDVAMLAFTALTLAVLARALASGLTTRRALWLGGFAGAALATKESAVGILLPVVLLVPWLGIRQRMWKAPAVALGASLVVFGLGSGLFVDPERYVAHIRFLSGHMQAAVSAQIHPDFTFPFTAAGNRGFINVLVARMIDIATLPGLLLGLAGMAVAVHRSRPAALFALTVPAYLLFEFVTMRSAQLRYLLPASFVLALFAGYALASLWQVGRTTHRTAAGLIAVAVWGLQAARGVVLTHAMLHDSRLSAGEWLKPRLSPGERVDYFGARQKLPPLAVGVASQLATPYLGMWGRHPTGIDQVRDILDRWRRDPPRYVLVIPDHTSRPGEPYDASMPPALYDSLMAGRAGFRLAALIQTPVFLRWPRTPPLDYPSVNPPIRIFEPIPVVGAGAPGQGLGQ
jgi:hypothetical protein